MTVGPGRGFRARSDQQIASVGGVDDLEALRLRRADHHDLLDSGMSAQAVGGANRDIPGDEDTDPHLGWTGDHSSAGSGVPEFRTRATTAAAARASRMNGERRFTPASL